MSWAGRGCVALAAVVVTSAASGCALVGVRTGDDDHGPVHVAVAATSGPAPEPTETADPLPQGWRVENLDFAQSVCPVSLAVGLPADWTAVTTSGSIRYFVSRDGSASLWVSCNKHIGNGDTAEVAASAGSSMFDGSDDRVAARRSFSLEGMSVGAFAGQVGPTSILGHGQRRWVAGAGIGARPAGVTYEITVYGLASQKAKTGKDTVAELSRHITASGKAVPSVA